MTSLGSPRRVTMAACFVLVVSALAAGVGAAGTGEWTIVPSPVAIDTQHNFLGGVAHASATSIWAVGYYWSGSANQTLTIHWDGNAWSLVPSPSTDASLSNFLTNVACAGESNCWAVGYHYTGMRYEPVILRWNGVEWSLVATPEFPPIQSELLYDVTCSSPSDCWAVGVYRPGINGGVGPNQTRIMRWDGAAWNTVLSPNTVPGRANTLVDVTCVSPADCWAVGYHAVETASQTLIQHWDGNEWTIVPSPNTSSAENNYLSRLTCLSTSDCWAVGVHTPLSGFNQTLIQHWDGESWSIVPSPNNSPTTPNVLGDVGCLSPEECWAVGYHRPASTIQTMIQRWDGSEWTLVPSPNTSTGQTNVLSTISCSAAGVCWATGNFYGPGSISKTLTLHYARPVTGVPTAPDEGTAVSLRALPNPGRAGDTRVHLETRRPAFIDVDVIDAGGRLVKRLFSGFQPRGRRVIVWAGDDEAGRAVGPGVYFVRAEGASERSSLRVVRVE